jgi:hypothetical protein
VAVTKKRVREILIESRNLMNDGGKHWIKSRLSRKRTNGEVSYCSVGSIFAVTDNVEEREAAIKVLAQKGLGNGQTISVKVLNMDIRETIFQAEL